MNINITTTHTITCDNAPVEDVFKELQEKCPDANPRESQVRLLVETKAEIAHELNKAQDEIDDLTRERDELQANVAELTRERDKAIIDSAVFAARGYELLASSRPALPEGMRIAEHPEHGRVVVSPGVDDEGDYKVFFIEESSSCKADYEYVAPSELMFLDSEPTPAPLPKPEDCKAGELYLARALGREVVAKRCAPKDGRFPWVTYATADDYSAWCSDSQITLLARLLPDRDIKERA